MKFQSKEHFWEELNHFQRLNEVKELKVSFSRNARIHGSRHRADDRCHAIPWRQQSRTAQARGARIGHVSAVRRRPASMSPHFPDLLGSSWVLVQAKRACAVQLAPPPSLFADFRPRASKVACLISLHLLFTCMYHTFSHTTFLGYNHMHSRASVFFSTHCCPNTSSDVTCVLGEAPSRLQHTVFLQRGCCCQGKEVVPVDHIRGKGLSYSGLKIILIAGFEPCLQGPAPSSLAAAHSPF